MVGVGVVFVTYLNTYIYLLRYLTRWTVPWLEDCGCLFPSSISGRGCPHLAVSNGTVQLQTGPAGRGAAPGVHRSRSVSVDILFPAEPERKRYNHFFICVKPCLSPSRPTPHITWTKDGQDLTATPQMKIKNFNKLIQIPKATFEDAGEYVCTATNKISHIQHTITVKVKGETHQTNLLWEHYFFCYPAKHFELHFQFISGSILVGEAHQFSHGPWRKWTYGLSFWWGPPPHSHVARQWGTHWK